MHDMSLLTDLLAIFAVSVVVVLLLARVGLPSVAGLIVAGVLIGPSALRLVDDVERVQVLSEIGVISLLFGIGLELPTERMRQLWRPIFVSGALQVTLTATVAYAVSRALGLGSVQALIVALVVAPSSTAIVLRQLDARGEVDAPHGKQMLGILLFQDLCVLPSMLVLPVLAGQQHLETSTLVMSLLRSLGLLLAVAVLARLLVPPLLDIVAAARKRDVFVLGIFVVGIGTAWVASLAGVSLSLGAFLAGVVVAGSHYRHQAMADLIPFREVFASLFFVSAGMLLDGRLLLEAPLPILALLAGLLLGKCLVVLLIGLLLRQTLRVALLTAIGLCQVGEFALVFLTSLRSKHALPDALEAHLLTAAILSMIATPPLLHAAPKLAALAERSSFLRRLYGKLSPASPGVAQGWNDHVIIAGYGVAGRALANRLSSEQRRVVVVDLNRKLLRDAKLDGFPARYGDVSTPEVLDHLSAMRASELVLLINDPQALERAVVAARRVAPELVITVRSRYQGEIAQLVSLGATHVVAAEVEAGLTITEQVLRRSLPAPEPGRSAPSGARAERSAPSGARAERSAPSGARAERSAPSGARAERRRDGERD